MITIIKPFATARRAWLFPQRSQSQRSALHACGKRKGEWPGCVRVPAISAIRNAKQPPPGAPGDYRPVPAMVGRIVGRVQVKE